MKKLRLVAYSLLLVFSVVSCKKEPLFAPAENKPVVNPFKKGSTSTTAAAYFTETFETGSKTSYTTGDVTLESGIWTLNDALIGTTTSDRKVGTKSVRIREVGKVSMKFDVTNGASLVSIKHAKFGTDGNSSWELWVSTNSGTSYTKVGNTITTSSTTLSTENFAVDISGNVRFEIRKVSGGTSRINFDDISIEEGAAAEVPATGFPETFEIGSKTSYTTADITLGSGVWTLNDALIGTSTSDRKVGTKSARVREIGKVSMKFNITENVTSFSVQHAKYGTDGNSSWELWASTDNGATYSKVGSTITTSSTTLETTSFSVNYTTSVRFEIRKISGGTNRINFDEISITTSSSSGGGGGGGGIPSGSDNTHLLMGNPSNATFDEANFTNYLMTKTEYVLSYHRDRGTANWVSWYLGPEWLGSTPRQDDFRADQTLPSSWYKVGSTSYSGSGFDRGHNAPSADRTVSVAANSATFLMTNMIPQAPNHNRQTWANMESYARTLVSQGNEVYIIMGNYGSGGTGSNGGTTHTIDQGRITVPSHIWKVMIVIPQGDGDLSRISSSTRVIAVNIPNLNTVSSSWGIYRTSVDAIEAATGYNIMSNVPVEIQNIIEAVIDNGPTN